MESAQIIYKSCLGIIYEGEVTRVGTVNAEGSCNVATQTFVLGPSWTKISTIADRNVVRDVVNCSGVKFLSLWGHRNDDTGSLDKFALSMDGEIEINDDNHLVFLCSPVDMDDDEARKVLAKIFLNNDVTVTGE